MNYFILAKIGNVNMTKTFQKTLIAASIGAVLAASSMVANAADNVLFPFVSSKAGAYTFVSLANTGAAPVASSYHFYYMTKPVGSANSVGCNHFDAIGKTTQNDLMQFEVSKKIDMKAAFGDTTSTAIHLPLAGHEGFLIVAADVLTAGLNFKGEATVVDAASGLYYSYSTANLATVANIDPDYSNAAITDAAVDKFTSWYPASAVNTTYYIVPTELRSVMAAVAGGGSKITLAANTAGIVGGGAYDINETPFSGTQNPKVTCFGYVKPSDYLQPGTAAATATGGFLTSTRVVVAGETSTGFLQYKVQDSVALGAKFTTIARDTAN
jgi:hypothetical protein